MERNRSGSFRLLGPMGRLGLLWTALVAAAARGAEAPPERVRLLCDENDPESRCPGRNCRCVDDTIEVTFDGDSASVIEYASFAEGSEIRVTIVSGTTAPETTAWSFGVAHDESALELVEVGIEGTDYAEAGPGCGAFDATGMSGIESCGDLECSDGSRTPGGGWIGTAVSFEGGRCSLPVKRSTIAWARYRLLHDVGENGTLVRFSDRLARRRSPRVDYNLTVSGYSRLWRTATDGWVKMEGGGPWVVFRRGDVGIRGPLETSPADEKVNVTDAVRILLALFVGGYSLPCADAADVDDDGAVRIDDAVGILRWLFDPGSGVRPAEPFPLAGLDPTPDELACEAGP